MKGSALSLWLLRIGLASVFVYAAVSATIAPYNWIGYFPVFLTKLIPVHELLLGFSLYQILLSVWLLSSKFTFYASLLTCATILGIIFANFGAMDIVFRDIAIFFAAASLAVATYKKK